MERRRQIYEGKAKVLYETDDPRLLIQQFKDDPRFPRRGGARIRPGVANNRISAALFKLLGKNGIPTHYVRTVSEREMLVRRMEIVRLEVVVRNVAAGSLSRRLGLSEGTRLSAPVVELYYKSDALGDPMVNETHVRVLGLAPPEELVAMRETALKANGVLLPFLAQREVLLVDFKLEFGRLGGRLAVADEMSPRTCRFWRPFDLAPMDPASLLERVKA